MEFIENEDWCFGSQGPYGAQCPASDPSVSDLHHGDCCSQDSHCAGTLVCHEQLRVCTSTCEADDVDSCPFEPRSTVGFGVPEKQCVARNPSDPADNTRVCKMESQCLPYEFPYDFARGDAEVPSHPALRSRIRD